MDQKTPMVVFEGKNIRRLMYLGQWWFVVEDIILILTDSRDPKQYINKMKQRDPELAKGWVQFVHTLPVPTEGGLQNMNCAPTQGIFRIIQSIPSPKAEPFKQWLAKVGYERVQEIQDPELAQQRMKELYRAKGYSDAWIEKRVRGIAIRQELTDEWKKRDVGGEREYAILTAEISKATFGLTPSEYKELKGLKRENLRDHMNDLELIFSMLGEAATTEITKNKNVEGFDGGKTAAHDGGAVAGRARKDLEEKSGKAVVSGENYLRLPEKEKKKLLNNT